MGGLGIMWKNFLQFHVHEYGNDYVVCIMITEWKMVVNGNFMSCVYLYHFIKLLFTLSWLSMPSILYLHAFYIYLLSLVAHPVYSHVILGKGKVVVEGEANGARA